MCSWRVSRFDLIVHDVQRSMALGRKESSNFPGDTSKPYTSLTAVVVGSRAVGITKGWIGIKGQQPNARATEASMRH